MGVLPFLAMCFIVLEGYVYTVAAYFYAIRLAAYCTAFCTILHYILLQIAPKQVQMPVAYNKYSLCRTHKLTPFSIKTNPRENRFFGARRAISGQKEQP